MQSICQFNKKKYSRSPEPATQPLPNACVLTGTIQAPIRRLQPPPLHHPACLAMQPQWTVPISACLRSPQRIRCEYPPIEHYIRHLALSRRASVRVVAMTDRPDCPNKALARRACCKPTAWRTGCMAMLCLLAAANALPVRTMKDDRRDLVI